jgi:predicted PurR-regulated permease PerM
VKEIQGRAERIEVDVPLATIAKVIGSLFAVWLAVQLWTVLVLVAVALMLVATFTPLVRALQARIARRWALFTVIVGLLLALVIAVSLIVPIVLAQGGNLLEDMPGYAHTLQDMLSQHGFKIDLHQAVSEFVGKLASGLPQVMSLVTNLVSWLFDVGTILVLTIYLLIEGPEVADRALRAFPREYRAGVAQLFTDVGVQVGNYMRGQLTLSLMAGTYFLVLLLLLRVTDAVALAIVAALADAVPLIGLLIALVPACLTALAISPWTAGLVAFFYLAYHQLEANVIAPRVFGKSLGLSVSVIVIAIVAGVKLMGVPGALLSLPVAAAVPGVMRYLAALHEQQQENDA